MAIKRKTRMYEPWGYVDENNYQGAETILENDLESFFAQVEYKRDDNKIHFANKDGEEKATLDVSEFVKSDSIVEKAWYEDGKIYVKFTNGDVITVDVEELIDQNEFAAGLQVNDGIVSILINAESDDYISVDTDGIKLTGVKADIEAEEARAISAETALDEKIGAEIARATTEEDRIDAKLDKEITDRIADVDEEEDRATEEETTIKNTIGGGFSTASTETVTAKFNALATALDTEIDDRTTQDNQLQNNINTETTAREAADTRLENLITDERNRAITAEEALDEKIDHEVADREADVDEEEARAISAETALDAKIDAVESALTDAIADEQTRAEEAETNLQGVIHQEVLDRKAEAVASAEYVKNDVKIYLKNKNGETLSEIDCNDFIVDGMIEDVQLVESGSTSVLVITWNTDSGSKKTTIDVGDIFEADNYYTKTDINSMVQVISDKIDTEETRATSAETDLQVAINGEIDRATAAEGDLQTAINGEATARADADTALQGAIEAEVTRAKGIEALKANSAEVDAALALKADKETTYTKEEVDALIAEKEAEIVQIKKDYNSLKEIVGELGGNVEWGVPADGTFNNMMKKSGTVKLGEDTTTSTYAGGITSNNKTTLHLNGKNLTFSGQTTTNPGIMARGKQEITIMGKGTIDAAGRIAVEANGADTVINLSGTTGMFGSEPTYVTDRSGGELIYCYLGTINIYAGVFKNNGDDKKFLLNCYDANRAAGTAKIIVYGGKFYDFNPADNSAEGEHTSFVPEGYHVETSTVTEEGVEHTVYTVKKD